MRYGTKLNGWMGRADVPDRMAGENIREKTSWNVFRSEPLTIEWTVKEDESILIHIKGEELIKLKETLDRFTQIELVDGFDRVPYYLLLLNNVEN